MLFSVVYLSLLSCDLESEEMCDVRTNKYLHVIRDSFSLSFCMLILSFMDISIHSNEINEEVQPLHN